MAKNPPAVQETQVMQVPSLGREYPLEEGLTTPGTCLGNPRDRGAWWATVHGVTESQKRLSMLHTLQPVTAPSTP